MSNTEGEISVVSDLECIASSKPQAKTIDCDSSAYVCDDPVCGNALWEDGEDCDTLLDTSCCESDCTRSTTTSCQEVDVRIDAAFIDKDGKMYLFQGDQWSRYASIDERSPESGFPQLISETFPIDEWTGDFTAAMCTQDNIVYIFKTFEYVRIDLDARGQIDDSPIEIVWASEFGSFGDMLSIIFCDPKITYFAACPTNH